MRRALFLIVGIVGCVVLYPEAAMGQSVGPNPWDTPCESATDIFLPHEETICTAWPCTFECEPDAHGYWYRFDLTVTTALLFEVERGYSHGCTFSDTLWQELYAGCENGFGAELLDQSSWVCDSSFPSGSDASTSIEIELTPGTYYLKVLGSFLWYYSTTCHVWDSDVTVRITPQSVAAGIDIIPFRINPFNRGVIPVAVLGGENLDITQIDVTTLNFGAAEAACRHDLTDEWSCNEHLEDVNVDGFTDLMLHFETLQSGIVCGDTESTLNGSLLDGTPIEGTDTFETVGCNSNRPRRGATSREFERMQRQQQPTNTEEQQHPGDLIEDQRVD
jgi:hypothetical protein